MTVSGFNARLRNFALLLRDMIFLSGLLLSVGGVVIYGVYAWHRDAVQGFVRAEFGLEDLATADSVTALSGELRDLARAVRLSSGEDRIFRQPIGMSYVSEPVRIGEPVVLNLVLQRTARGADCRFLGAQSLFTDQTNVTLAGSRIEPTRQVGPEPARLRLEIAPPPSLMAGRVELHLAAEYACPDEDGVAFDRTDVIPYTLLP